MKRMRWVVLPVLVVCLTVAAVAAEKSLILATTTSTQQIGLLDQLLPAFTKATGIEVKPIAVGTGKAFELARQGNADVVMAHARKLEDAFVADGYGVDAWDLMYNDFVLVGPAADPAGIASASSAADAMKRIASGAAPFISRADKSGTHEKELELWNLAGGKMTGANYVEAGQGMSEVLLMAGQKKAYTLTDRATWLTMKKKLDLVMLYQNPPELKNSYAVIAVNNAKVPTAKTDLAKNFVEWVTSPAAQSLIASFTLEGETLFYLSVGKR